MTTYHFIGIGGIGMSALARIALQRGDCVQGTDASPSSLITLLKQEGAVIRIGHDPSWLDRGMTVVYSSDIKESHPERRRAQALGLPCLHRSDLLDRFLRMQKPLLVTGTHGKTTTTALLATLLSTAGLDPSFAVGGISRTHGTNGRFGRGAYFVAEADESDGSFLKTPSEASIVTNVEPEHLDYWGSIEALEQAFLAFFEKSRFALWCADDARLSALRPSGLSYGFSPQADVRIVRYAAEAGAISFDLRLQGQLYEQIHLPLLGRHNALNGAAVFAMAHHLAIPEAVCRTAFRSFCGTQRRLEKKGEVRSMTIYDDYGHHPTEIRVTLQALRQEIGARRLVVLFQPHRYTRVRDCFDLFLDAFQEADLLVMTDIYAAREMPIPGISSERLYQALCQRYPIQNVQYIERSLLEQQVAQQLQPHDVVLTLGAGDITVVAETLSKTGM